MQHMTSLDYIRDLTEVIGPRGSTSEEEAKAADYAADQLKQIGLAPQRQTFLSATSAYAPYALFAGLALLSIVLFWQPQPVGAAGAAVLTGTALVSLILELLFRSNLLRWCLPVDESQNVFATVPCVAHSTSADESPAQRCAQTVVITAHLDTHRTPLVFHSPAWLKVFRLLMPLGIGSAVLLLVLFVIGVFVSDAILRQIALLPGAVLLAVFVLMVQADQTPYTKGADDNASGVATVLLLAERLVQAPLQHTAVTVVFTGCEEVACYGADAYLQEHGPELRNAIHLVIDQVGGAGTVPCVVRGERFLAPAPSDPGLLAIADRVVAEHPELDATTLNLSTAYGELSIGVKHDLRTIALGSLRKDGTSPHWHKASDTLENVDVAVLERSLELAWQLLRGIDASVV
ncbi:MAG: M28 family metallopeptidase [Chloroflexi bacterium]|nr:M28 family metallopeptidase [Chloroflexota bacterium]